ncbi:MAG: amidase [Gammaproteobacteria bacterium]|nr:amidase [Gammaproteobacteria bacterium]MDH5629095.1 amidase [Gammaproteobacteria bacterium]
MQQLTNIKPIKMLFKFFIIFTISFQASANDVVSFVNDDSAFAKNIHQSTIPELQKQMNEGKLSSEKLVKFFLKQMEKKEPYVNSIILVNPKALALAKQSDKDRKNGNIKGPLHGIPVILKDNIETYDMPTTAGSLVLKDNHTKRDAPLVKKLREAGAIIFAKANLSEWANFRSERSSSGWSGVGGQTRNPHDISRTACGSSSGSGASIAANLGVVAIGTETNGSITCPASVNGLVGIKPTVGLVSRTGVVPISHTQDTAGPMAKNVTDAAIVLAVIQGVDESDSATKARPFDFSNSYQPDGQFSLKGLRIGVLKSGVKPHEVIDKLFSDTLSKLKVQGAVLVEDLSMERYEDFGKDSYDVLLYEFKHDLNQYFAGLPNQYNQLTLEKVIEFNKKNKEQEMPYFLQEIFVKAQAKGPLTDKEYTEALAKVREATREKGLDALFAEHKLDILITPTRGAAWSIDIINGDQSSGGYSTFSAISGYSHLTMPMGKAFHMPIGLSVVGLAMDEDQVIKAAREIEAAIK